MSATVAIQGKGKKVGTPNYKNEVLLNLIEFYLPAGNEQWKIVAQRYQEVSKEAFLRYHDDIKRHFNDKLCKKNQRQTGINNKSGPLPLVARAQEIQRKILINEATISVGGENENDADDDDEEDDFGPTTNDKENEEKADEAAVPVSADVRPKKKAKVDDGMKTKNSKPTQSNPRGGIAGSIADLASNIGSNQSLGLMMNMMQQQQQQFQQQQQQQNQQMMMMMMMMMNGRPPTGTFSVPSSTTPFSTASHTHLSTSTNSLSHSGGHDITDLSDI